MDLGEGPASLKVQHSHLRFIWGKICFGEAVCDAAFTGAIAQKIGRFELSHEGTIFLDEVGEIPLELQSTLLRVLQEQEFERLGSTRTIRVDVRLIAATNRDLERLSYYHWPGNIRELANLIERAGILSQGSDLQVPIGELKLEGRLAASSSSTFIDAEREQILRMLRETRWVIGGPVGVAAKLDLKRTTLSSKMKKLGLTRPQG